MSAVDSPLGSVEGNVLTFRRVYPDPPETVWAAITESDRVARWFGSFTGDARPGRDVQFVITAAEDAGGPPSTVRIDECEPPRRLRVRISDDGGGEPWEISVDLEPAPEGTVLGFRQVLPAGFSPSDVGPGWHWYLDRLGAHLAGEAFPAWPDYEALAGRYS